MNQNWRCHVFLNLGRAKLQEKVVDYLPVKFGNEFMIGVHLIDCRTFQVLTIVSNSLATGITLNKWMVVMVCQ
jgi:hypothetical protein